MKTIKSQDVQVTITIKSSHGSFTTAVKSARKHEGSFIVVEEETSRTNARWLVAVVSYATCPDCGAKAGPTGACSVPCGR